jgi:hypothetical protein
VPEILEYLKEIHKNKKVKNVNALTNTDLKLLKQKNSDLKF